MIRKEIAADDPYNIGFHNEPPKRDPASAMPRWILKLIVSIGLLLLAWIAVYGCRGNSIASKLVGEDPWVTVRTDTLTSMVSLAPFNPDHRPTRVVVSGGANTIMNVTIQIQDEADENEWLRWVTIVNPGQGGKVFKQLCPTPTQLRVYCDSYSAGIATIEWQHLKAEEVKK